MSLEHLFASSTLALAVPDTSVVYPPTQPVDKWLQILSSNTQERRQAFFGGQPILFSWMPIDQQQTNSCSRFLH
jgi:hypothetical protein